MADKQFVVPTLSLASSRAKRNVPTKDSTSNRQRKIFDSNCHSKMSSYRSGGLYEQQSLYLKSQPAQNIPKSNKRIFQKSEEVSNNRERSIDLNKNVYLSNNSMLSDDLNQSASQQRLDINQLSYNGRTQPVKHQPFIFKKIDINKTLFERKLQKLFQQAQFYQNQLLTQPQDPLKKCMDDLLQLKNDSIELQKSMIMSLSHLIV